MGVFRFKKFNVVNERSAMKVNTDGVLLGAAMTIRPDDRLLLDVGTGTGTIALMAAQRLLEIPGQAGDDAKDAGDDGMGHHCRSDRQYLVAAIDIDEPSASEAGQNFQASPWADILHAYNKSLEEYAVDLSPDHMFDLIFSNPPYFEDSLTAPDERKSTARHTSDGLSYRDIFDFAKERLTEAGRVALVLPADQEAALTRYARMSGLHLQKILRVRTVPRKSPTRIIAEFSRQRCQNPEEHLLTIQNGGQYTPEYLDLMKDFYLFA